MADALVPQFPKRSPSGYDARRDLIAVVIANLPDESAGFFRTLIKVHDPDKIPYPSRFALQVIRVAGGAWRPE